ncbi:MAG: hypothetical protein AMXMBFR31_13670 [Candidatus Desulfobacillus denitrificans]
MGEAVDRPQRRAQVVRNRIAEGLQLPVRFLQLPRALGHALLELGIQLGNGRLVPLAAADVLLDGDEVCDPTLRILERRDADVLPEQLAILLAAQQLAVPFLPAAQGSPETGVDLIRCPAGLQDGAGVQPIASSRA